MILLIAPTLSLVDNNLSNNDKIMNELNHLKHAIKRLKQHRNFFTTEIH